MAINDALALVEKTGNLPVPLHLRNAPTKLMKDMDYGKDYKYAHNYEGNFVKQDFLPEKIKNISIWKPQSNQAEERLRAQMNSLWKERY